MGMSMAGKRRAKVIMADLVLTSGLSTSRVKNSINFLVAYASGVVVGNPKLNLNYSLIAIENLTESARSTRVLASYNSHRCAGQHLLQ